VQGQDNSEQDETIELSDAWWEGLGPPPLHPVRVQIIEALRWVGEPLYVPQLRDVLDGVTWAVCEHHLKHLKALGAVALIDRPARLHLFARYRLVVEEPSGG